MVNAVEETSSRYHICLMERRLSSFTSKSLFQWPICVRELNSIQYNMVYRPDPIKRPGLGIMVSSGANNVLGSCGTKADYRWNQGVARSCLPQVSSQPGLISPPSLLFLQPIIACCCNARFVRTAWNPVRPRYWPHSLGIFQRRQQRVFQVLIVNRAPSIPSSWLRIRCRSCRSWLCRLRWRWHTWLCLLGRFS